MLLLATNRDDLTADWLVLELRRRGASYFRFNTEDFPQYCQLSWRVDTSGLRIRGRELAASEIDSVWFRRPVAPQIRPGLPAPDAAWATREAAEALQGFWRTLDCRWVSRPDAIRLADCKPRQLVDAAALGFEIPDTEVTNDVERVRALRDRNPEGLICKPLRDGRVRADGPSLFFTSLISDEHIDAVADEPHLFQALVPKRYDIRVTVIGDEVFSARIESQDNADSRIDWRRGQARSLRYARENLPDQVAHQCRALVRHYGLGFGAIDLARRPDGGYTFFELNPNGQWAFVEQLTGQPLRSCLADLLLAET
jgi:glutathione synthase/RimK-type ligase-like ATP-grasp enzyme